MKDRSLKSCHESDVPMLTWRDLEAAFASSVTVIQPLYLLNCRQSCFYLLILLSLVAECCKLT